MWTASVTASPLGTFCGKCTPTAGKQWLKESSLTSHETLGPGLLFTKEHSTVKPWWFCFEAIKLRWKKKKKNS